jgi:hypothetical protein
VKLWLRPSLNNLSFGKNNSLQDRNVHNFVTYMIHGGCMSIDKSLLRMKRASRSLIYRRAFQHFPEDIARPRETSFGARRACPGQCLGEGVCTQASVWDNACVPKSMCGTRRACPGQCLKSEIPVTKEEDSEFRRSLYILFLSATRSVLFCSVLFCSVLFCSHVSEMTALLFRIET